MKNKYIFYVFIIISLFLYKITPHYAGLMALIMGISLSSVDKFYRPKELNKYRKLVLNSSIIFFGFSLNINDVIAVGAKGAIVSAISLVIVITFGMFILKYIKLDQKTGELITYGTSICGGSAISAVSAILNPSNKQLAISTAIVFILNGIALFVFPIVGHILDMNQMQFGMFAALSIHDVSSVVGAASIYGDEALKYATILKLTRTLWIIPITLILSRKYQVKNTKLPIPFFIILFLCASIITSIANQAFITNLNVIGKYLLPVALFMVGYGIKINDIRESGKQAIYFGLILWAISITVAISLAFIFA